MGTHFVFLASEPPFIMTLLSGGCPTLENFSRGVGAFEVELLLLQWNEELVMLWPPETVGLWQDVKDAKIITVCHPFRWTSNFASQDSNDYIWAEFQGTSLVNAKCMEWKITKWVEFTVATSWGTKLKTVVPPICCSSLIKQFLTAHVCLATPVIFFMYLGIKSKNPCMSAQHWKFFPSCKLQWVYVIFVLERLIYIRSSLFLTAGKSRFTWTH